ncbi:uncharacterized protein LOC134225579 [Armigeres subalbatus]|uniref:uncharacterized protein LOC134225579 n=1 Tax=Armigeres subalbatus TaxID=124917 RepID=UPI002ED0081A
MYDYDILIEKCEDFQNGRQKFRQMFDNVIETVLCMQMLMSEMDTNYNKILQLLKSQPKKDSSPSPQKRRKAQSFDSPSSTMMIVRQEVTPRNRSDPEVSASILDQNIELPDTEDSFFALTQSPTVRDPLSPVKRQDENAAVTAPNKNSVKAELFPNKDESKTEVRDKKKKKSILSLSRFSSSFETSPETSKQAEMLPMRQKTTPKHNMSRLEQENVAPPLAKWTAKKPAPGTIGKSDSMLRKTPTSSFKKDESLLNRTRMRQTKLKFPDSLNKSLADDDETYFEEFVVPSPTSVTTLSGSRFSKSAKKKEQSTFVAPPVAKTNTTDDEDFDIDQTYFSEAEKDLTRPKQLVRPAVPTPRIKTEPTTQKTVSLFAPKPAVDTQSSDTSSVLFVKPPSQDIITIEESQPNKKDLFMDAIREETRKEDTARLSVLNVMGPSKRDVKKVELFPMKTDFKMFMKSSGPQAVSNERRCSNCTKQLQYLLNCGHTADFARTKLPQSCRECRLAQLHETPPGFWNPEFTPTQL